MQTHKGWEERGEERAAKPFVRGKLEGGREEGQKEGREEGRKEDNFICTYKANMELVWRKPRTNLIYATESSKGSGFGWQYLMERLLSYTVIAY